MGKLSLPPDKKVWLPYREGSGAKAVRSYGSYRPVYHMQIAATANPDREAGRVLLQFPDAGFCFVFKDADQLRVVIDQLTQVYKQVSGRGESRIVSFEKESERDNEVFSGTVLNSAKGARVGGKAGTRPNLGKQE